MKFSSLKRTGLAASRAMLGLSQQQLAEQLGISKAAIGMAETGRRTLPVAALIKLAQLEIKLAAASVPTKDSREMAIKTEMQSSFRGQAIAIRELECELQIQKLSNSLENITTQYKRFQIQLQLLDEVLAKESGKPADRFMLGLQLHRDRIIRQLDRCSPTDQSLLRYRIALLSAESHLNKSVRQQFNIPTTYRQ